MDEFLARIYNTAGGEDIEKTAQAHFLQKLANDGEADLSELSDEDLLSLADEAGVNVDEGEGQEQDPMEAQAQQEYLQKEAEAKFEEADFLGRVMAHAYTQELEKIAMSKTELGMKARHYAGKAWQGVKDIATAKQFRSGRKQVAEAGKASERRVYHPANYDRVSHGSSGRASRAAGKLKSMHERAGRGEMLRGGAKTLGMYGGAATAAGAGAHAAFGKEASAIEKLAMLKAAEMLDAVGIDPQSGQPYEQQAQGSQPGMQGQPGQQPQGQPGGVNPQAIQQEIQRRRQMAQGQQQPGQQGQPGMQQPGMQGQQPGQPGQQGMQGQQPGGEDEQLDDVVNQRALEMLEQAGYDPEALVEALSAGAQ